MKSEDEIKRVEKYFKYILVCMICGISRRGKTAVKMLSRVEEGIIAFKCGFYLVNNYMSIVIVSFMTHMAEDVYEARINIPPAVISPPTPCTHIIFLPTI